ncbi:RNA polymerase II mediator complex subunit [Dimargaris cristalligena]|uniref:Mediator of RNA polymerase II transcription subunit 10 n=1 Tax=Dimargaris cristalligena TaxID=215637 RepID=A0A4P9ZKJ6_9FUNG|nr:RNA polymerase II mediator complex subunit [Dimargaris cristalligena]RKP33578.1 transcription factor subunit Med10 of mediator complex-domain-containing protein [Dimargaris cristalligena]|eukprot:RKP33578.1 transcription factor subunit Med10 of mediator complex-domain-containing protein [Dimargaris cristalligena]
MASSDANRPVEVSSPCRQAEAKVKEIIDTLFELGITVHEFQSESGPVVHNRISDLIAKFAQLDELKDSVEGSVPLDVISCVEEGRNPDCLMRDVLDQVAAENQFTNGKIQSVRKFKDILLNELGNTLPEETKAYEEIHKAKVASTNNRL